MKKIFSLGGIGSIASIIALTFFIYYQFIVVESLVIEIKTINEEELTRIPEISDFRGSFTFKDSLVNNLWKIRLSLKNVGNKTLIGEGENKDIIGDSLKLSLGDGFEIINIETKEGNFPIKMSKLNNQDYLMKFKQWRPNEYVELIAFVENEERKPLTKFIIDERSILNGIVRNVDFKVAEKPINKRLIDIFPKGFQNVLWWIAVVYYIIIFVVLIFQEFSKEKWLSSVVSTILIFILFLLPLLWMI